MSDELNKPRRNVIDVTWEGKSLIDGNQYDADYFLRGKETGKSLYENYRWMPELTIPMVASMVSHLKIEPTDTILDFGCARGYAVRAFLEMGYDVWGYDISKWALENADEKVKNCLLASEPMLLVENFDWVIAKDVLEHVPFVSNTIAGLMKIVRKGVFAVVPLSMVDGHPYVVGDYEKDVTHIHRMTLATWVRFFTQTGWSVEARYRVRGIKDNYSGFPTGNGFITARRIGE